MHQHSTGPESRRPLSDTQIKSPVVRQAVGTVDHIFVWDWRPLDHGKEWTRVRLSRANEENTGAFPNREVEDLRRNQLPRPLVNSDRGGAGSLRKLAAPRILQNSVRPAVETTKPPSDHRYERRVLR
jgi:hypothetical protein